MAQEILLYTCTVMKKNPINIPDIMPLYNHLVEFVKEKQGEKEFILTDNSNNDTMWAVVWDGELGNTFYELEIKGVCVKDDKLYICVDELQIKYNDADLAQTNDEGWLSILFDERILFVQTLFSLAECLYEYVD